MCFHFTKVKFGLRVLHSCIGIVLSKNASPVHVNIIQICNILQLFYITKVYHEIGSYTQMLNLDGQEFNLDLPANSVIPSVNPISLDIRSLDEGGSN